MALRYRLTEGGLVPVLIPSFLRKPVFYVYVLDRHGVERPLGTGFVVLWTATEFSSVACFVTARHLIEQARIETSADHLLLRVNTPDGKSAFIEAPFESWRWHPGDVEDEGSDWVRARDELRYDVAVLPAPDRSIVGPIDITPLVWPETAVVTPPATKFDEVVLGDDIAIAGLYRNHTGRERNIPLVRSGIVAATPEEPVLTKLGPMDAYLIEARSIGGLSGSPVYWMAGHYRYGDDEQIYPQEKYSTRVMGLIHGHFDDPYSDLVAGAYGRPERLNEGIAIVAPARHVTETLEGLVAEQEKSLVDAVEASGAAMDSLVGDAADGERDTSRVSLAGVDPEAAIRALLRTPPHAQTQDPA